MYWPSLPFMDRVGLVFLLSLGIAIVVSLGKPGAANANRIEVSGVSYATSNGFNIASIGVIMVLIALYVSWW